MQRSKIFYWTQSSSIAKTAKSSTTVKSLSGSRLRTFRKPRLLPGSLQEHQTKLSFRHRVGGSGRNYKNSRERSARPLTVTRVLGAKGSKQKLEPKWLRIRDKIHIACCISSSQSVLPDRSYNMRYHILKQTRATLGPLLKTKT